MKVIKICIVIIVVLLVFGIGFSVYVWYTIQNIPTAADIPMLQESSQVTSDESATKITVPTEEKPETTVTKTESVPPTVIETETLSETQQTMLKSMGYTKDTVTITKEMITCAEDAVGAARLKGIMDGAAPSPMESLKLLPCFKQ
ncbi:hypothetical protein IPH92_02785 [Candidatus Kaiserbacteria bacterium]|nr:MAG: hypothetical protein IPH92_02785 [Candidatus Kaiserbacteria bacterium]